MTIISYVWVVSIYLSSIYLSLPDEPCWKPQLQQRRRTAEAESGLQNPQILWNQFASPSSILRASLDMLLATSGHIPLGPAKVVSKHTPRRKIPAQLQPQGQKTKKFHYKEVLGDPHTVDLPEGLLLGLGCAATCPTAHWTRQAQSAAERSGPKNNPTEVYQPLEDELARARAGTEGILASASKLPLGSIPEHGQQPALWLKLVFGMQAGVGSALAAVTQATCLFARTCRCNCQP